MGVEQALMDHLFVMAEALREGHFQTESYGPTPKDLGGGTPNQKLLRASVAYCDAVAGLPGTDLPQALELVQWCVDFQKESHCKVGGAQEPLTPSHGQLWWGGWCGILAAATQANDPERQACGTTWVRAEAALCHLAGHLENGEYCVIAPGARGGPEEDKTFNPARDLGYHLLVTGEPWKPTSSIWDQKYYVGPILLRWLLDRHTPVFQGLRSPGPGTPLQGPGGIEIWSQDDLPNLIDPLHVQRKWDDHVAWFPVLDALQPQWIGTFQEGKAQYWNWNGNPEWQNGGPCPYPVPELQEPSYSLVVK